MDTPIQDKRRATVTERFDKKWLRGGEDECWPWVGHKVRGYGQIRIRTGKQVSAHIFAYLRANGPDSIPDGYVLDHTCHPIDGSCLGGEACPHRACVNPSHLTPVTRGDNSRRCVPPHLRVATHLSRLAA